VFKYQSASQKQYTKLNQDDDGQAEVTPLSIAGRSGHIGCVKLILDHCLGRYHGCGIFSGKDAHINMACQLDSPFALQFLLSQYATYDIILCSLRIKTAVTDGSASTHFVSNERQYEYNT
jgi:hypothetical protein